MAFPKPVSDFKPHCLYCGEVLALQVKRPWKLTCYSCQSTVAIRDESSLWHRFRQGYKWKCNLTLPLWEDALSRFLIVRMGENGEYPTIVIEPGVD